MSTIFTTFVINRLLFVAILLLGLLPPELTSPAPQTNRTKSDADIDAIGHRSIVHDTDLYTPDKEKELGKAVDLTPCK